MQELEASLRATLAHALPLDNAQRLAVRDAVCAFVDRSRDAGTPIERIIIDVKRIAREAGMTPPKSFTGASSSPNDDLIVAVVRWCIERYYFPPRAD